MFMMSTGTKIPFIGRQNELKKLQDLFLIEKAKLVVIKGRRRVGKSRLIEEFAKNKRFLSFSGLAPVPGLKAQDQRDEFASQLCAHFGIPNLNFKNWTNGFNLLSKQLGSEPTIILFDEISWMGLKDPTFIPKLKTWWDLVLQQYSNVTLIFCGSISTWIEKNIINSTAFFGRIALTIDLSPLSIFESSQLLKAMGFKGSAYDIFKILSVTGGIPWYLEHISPFEMADANIKRLCFEKDGILTLEFDRIFHDLFNGHGSLYKKIVYILGSGMRNLSEIRKSLDYPFSGRLSTYIKNLITSGFVTQHYQWSLKSGRLNKQSLYRLSDPYARFFIKYIEPNLPKIEQNTFQDLSLNQLPGWDAMMGFQLESLLLKNRNLLIKTMGIQAGDILSDNPYIQYPTSRKKGCQIDYLIQTQTKNLFLCEFKFTRRELNSEIITSMQEKINRFSTPRGFAVVPVLFHLSGVTDTVYEQHFFYRIIDIADFLDPDKKND